MSTRLYERRRPGRSISLSHMLNEYSYEKTPSPLLAYRARSRAITIPMSTSFQDQLVPASDFEEEEEEGLSFVMAVDSSCNFGSEFEIAELSRSPTSSGHRVWSFTPTHTPPSKRKDRHQYTESPDMSSGRATPTSVCASLKKLVRGVHCSSPTYSLDDRRRMVIGELIYSERKYISNLEILLNVFLPSLETVVAPRDLRLMFPAQLEPLLERHKDLLSRLEERAGEASRFHGIVGDIFGKLCSPNSSEFVNVYSAYMNEFQVAMKTLAKYEQSSPQFKEALQVCQCNPECEGLSLAAYLLTPIQRLPRYELLLKELLKNTPIDHPDNYSVGDAVDRLREEMVRLNQSIKSCQLACSMARVKNGRRPFKRFTKARKTGRGMKRHVSTANIDDYSSGDSSDREGGVRLPRLPRHHSVLDNSLYRSSESLVTTDMGEEIGRRQYHLKGPISSRDRAASCSDLLLDLDETRQRLSLMPALESLPSIPPSPAVDARISSPTSVLPLSSEDSCPRSRSRASVYSTTSSTSGIESLGQSQIDLLAALVPMPPPAESTPIPVKAAGRSEGEGKPSARRKTSWSAAFKLLKRKSSGMSSPKVLDISTPEDFRHVQHGFTENKSSSNRTCTPSGYL